MLASAPSLTDYTNFHGMLCRVGTARRCIQSFDGVALFADQSTYHRNDHDLSSVDYKHKGILLGLSVVNYYLLVLFSLTGACTLVGRTKFLAMQDGLFDQFHPHETGPMICSKETKETLCMPPKVLDYIRKRSADLDYDQDQSQPQNSSTPPLSQACSNDDTVVLKRRFEYEFGGYLSVMMLHFQCSRGRTHLVEVYRVHSDSALGRVVNLLLQPLRFLDLLTRGLASENARKLE
ncbi:hypothetical protein IV203_010524 [Nitzschia inconspicua]|uniref:Uncharacterized protein n=1 Tax=Nitzschia inconspicua TaxID=303405 RepID=A0A9K3PN60_9STRA|nr:hypothetical protein IV203_010524 [Nitzschia inconspicua]